MVDAIKKPAARLPRSRFRPGVELDVLFDRSDLHPRSRCDDVQFTLLLALALVVLVIFLFLRNLSATIIPSLALPMSIIGTFAVMYLLGYSLDNLSLMALTLSVGFVVDDAIVMLENIVRHMEMGKTPMQATLDGSQGDRLHHPVDDAVAGRRVHPGAVHGRHPRAACCTSSPSPSSSAILVSGFVSLTLTPMLCSRFLRSTTRARTAAVQASERVFDAAARCLRRTLGPVLRHQRSDDGGLRRRSLVVTGCLFVIMPKGFLPSEDTGQLFGFTEAAQDISFDAMCEHQQQVADDHRARTRTSRR